MMKYLYIGIIGLIFLNVTACNDELEISNPEVVLIDSTGIISTKDYFLRVTIGDTSMRFSTASKSVANDVFNTIIAPCSMTPGYDSTQYSSYFSYVADTNRNEIVSFGLINCVPPDANGYRDSTYVVGDYPIENTKVDTNFIATARGFINYVDKTGVLWSSSLAQKGYGAQEQHSFVLTDVNTNYTVTSVFDIQGTFSGWIYNGTGDSLLVSEGKFNSQAWALH